MAKTTTTETVEYDFQGRVVKKTVVKITEETTPEWPQPYRVTCGIQINESTNRVYLQDDGATPLAASTQCARCSGMRSQKRCTCQ